MTLNWGGSTRATCDSGEPPQTFTLLDVEQSRPFPYQLFHPASMYAQNYATGLFLALQYALVRYVPR